jgi:beta-lactamase regulating signal transducer with metallopeptidase domain
MSSTFLTTSPVWTAAGWTMLHLLWASAAVGLMAALVRRLLKSARPETRYAVALTCLLAMSMSPALIFVRIFVPDSGTRAMTVRSRSAPAKALPSVADTDRHEQARPKFRNPSFDRPVTDPAQSRIDSLVRFLPWFWLCGSLSTMAMLVTGLVGVEQLRRSSGLVESGDIPRRCRAMAGSLGITRRVGVGICDRLAMPVLIGIVRPLILLPPAALFGWSVEQLEMAMLHELAHVRRWDNLMNLLQRFVESLLFFHPVVWWLSEWVRLERELCCDRLVVERVGQPVAYAEMLVALAGTTHRRRQIMVAMADRQVLTQIRRLLNLEERSMKLTMPEGLGLMSAVIVGVSLVLGSQAAPPKPSGESAETIRQALRMAADSVEATPPNRSPGNSTAMTLINVAEAMLKLGDRTTALATLQRAYESIDQVDPPSKGMPFFGDLIQIAGHQRLAGDLVGSKVSLSRAARIVESFKSGAAPHDETQRAGHAQNQRDEQEVSAANRSELFLYLAEELTAAGDPDLARALCSRAMTAIQLQKDVQKPIVLAGIARSLFKTGDVAGARDAIKQARDATTELPNEKEKESSMATIAQAMVEIGDMDDSMAMLRTVGTREREKAITRIIESLADDNFKGAWADPGGIKIVIGAEMMKVKDLDMARRTLPRLAQVVCMSNDRLAQARLLSKIASLQADASDFTGARQTVDSIPDVKRADFPGPSDGFYDAIKPAILAMIAQHQFEAGDKAGASRCLRQAIALAWAIETADQKIVAQIVIAQKHIECGDRGGAHDLLKEAIPFAQIQAEPLRSRSLAMFVDCQLKSSDPEGAIETTSAIRDYPGPEKRRALHSLADWYEKAGDQPTAQGFLQQCLRITEAKAPANFPPLAFRPPAGKVKPQVGIAARSFIDYEYEIDPKLIEHQNEMASLFLHAQLGDREGALRMAQATQGPMRNVILSNLAGQLAHSGDVTGAMKLATTFETAEERLTAIQLVACAIRDRDTIK